VSRRRWYNQPAPVWSPGPPNPDDDPRTGRGGRRVRHLKSRRRPSGRSRRPIAAMVGREMTTAHVVCSGCGVDTPIGSLIAQAPGPGITLRCPGCNTALTRASRVSTGSVHTERRPADPVERVTRVRSYSARSSCGRSMSLPSQSLPRCFSCPEAFAPTCAGHRRPSRARLGQAHRQEASRSLAGEVSPTKAHCPEHARV
jgi:hypothetical protein